MLKLYYATGTCALASHIALEEAGATYTTNRLDFKANQQQSPDYLKINAKGRVPALVTDKGVITETPAILAFIAQSFPKAKLAPFEDPFAFAQVQSINSYLCSTVHVAHAHKGRGYRWATEETSFADMKRKVPETMAACFALIERDLLKGPWVMGEQYTICDPYLYTISGWLEGDGVDLSKLPERRRPPQADGSPSRRAEGGVGGEGAGGVSSGHSGVGERRQAGSHTHRLIVRSAHRAHLEGWPRQRCQPWPAWFDDARCE